MKYLKPRKHYEDLYDKHTVDECRHYLNNTITEEYVGKHFKEKKKGGIKRMSSNFNEFILYFVQGERYAKKEEVIAEWMRKAEQRDRFFETTEAPSGIRCLTCNKEMFVSSKNLDIGIDEKDRIMFMYDCYDGHLPCRVFYDNGEEWEREKPTCVKCKAEVEVAHEDTKDTFKTVYTCPSCGHVEVDEFERTVKKEPEAVDPEFEKDRKRFCDPEKGLQYVSFKRNLEELHKLTEKEKEKEEKKDLYNKVEKLKKLSIPQVKDFIEKKLSKTQYKNLTFEKPDMGHIVSITFTTEDPTDTDEYDSRMKLTKTLKKALEKTNWRLMTDGVSYRLGILTGRIRVYEKEEELIKLVE